MAKEHGRCRASALLFGHFGAGLARGTALGDVRREHGRRVISVRLARFAGYLVAAGLIWLPALSPAFAGAPKITVIYVYTNPEGTPLARADADGNIIARYDYKPYGAPVAPVPGQLPAGPGYTGHMNDPGTGLVYMQQRYYDPAIGRFLSPDPVVPSAGNVFNFNRYSYANNNPIKNIDPDGKACRTGLSLDPCGNPS